MVVVMKRRVTVGTFALAGAALFVIAACEGGSAPLSDAEAGPLYDGSAAEGLLDASSDAADFRYSDGAPRVDSIREDSRIGVQCPTPRAWNLPPTGQEQCFDAAGDAGCLGTAGDESCATQPGCGQDAQYGDRSRNFSLHAAGSHEVVVDELTGLMWQRRYEEGGEMVQSFAVGACDDLVYGGYDDWRLPTALELASISPVSDEQRAAFPFEHHATVAARYWTQTGDPILGSRAFTVDGSSGTVRVWSRSYGNFVRCVRCGPLEARATDRFSSADSGGDTLVTDDATGLIWTQTREVDLSWNAALAYCEGLSYGGHSDWRLPDIWELRSLVDWGRDRPSTAFPAFESDKLEYWASTTARQPELAWIVDFEMGASDPTILTARKAEHLNSVRCVR